MTQSFTEKVYALARRIPRGKVGTYQELARQLRNPRAVRAVGNALNKSPGMSKILRAIEGPKASPAYGRPRVPCYRVVRADGSVGGFAGGTKAKITLLKKEGIMVRKGKVDLEKFGWR